MSDSFTNPDIIGASEEGRRILSPVEKAAIRWYLDRMESQIRKGIQTATFFKQTDKSPGSERNLNYWRHCLACVRWMRNQLKRED